MKKYFTKTLATVIAILLTIFTIHSSCFLVSAEGTSMVEPEIKTISEIGNPTMTSTSYYDDGTLFYTNRGSTVGYNYDHSNTIFDFNIIFTALEPASIGWFGFSTKVSAFDRYNASALEQKGYGIMIKSSGSVSLTKGGTTVFTTTTNRIYTNQKYNIKLGAINKEGQVNVIFKIDNNEVINYVDSENPYLTGNWFNMNGDGTNISAEIISTKIQKIPTYQTYTLSTISRYPSCADNGDIIVDRYNNITFEGGASCVGFSQALQNFSFEVNVNFEKFAFPANFWISARATSLNRSPSCGGYSFRFSSSGGGVWVYKNGSVFASGNLGFSLQPNVDYIIEIGTIDLSETSTYLFIKCNNKIALAAFDNESPIQKMGFLNINGEGTFAAKLTSSYTGATPLQTVFSETETDEIIKVYFQNPISYKDLEYNDFSEKTLKAILINDSTIYNLNQLYYSLDNSKKVNAINIRFYDNVLEISKSKIIYKTATETEEIFELNDLCIKKTTSTTGIETFTDFVLKETYYVSK